MDYNEAAKELLIFMQMMGRPNHEKNIISRGEGIMLECVAKNGGVLMPGEIARKVEVSTARVAAFLNSAESKGYIQRQNVKGDRRKVNVVLTDKGYEIVRKEREKMIKRTRIYLEKLGFEDTENLIRIVKKTQEILNCDEFKEDR